MRNFLIYLSKSERIAVFSLTGYKKQNNVPFTYPGERCVPIKGRSIHVRETHVSGTENPRHDGCLNRVRDIRGAKKPDTVLPFSPDERERGRNGSTKFQYFGHIAEVWKSREGRKARGKEGRAQG